MTSFSLEQFRKVSAVYELQCFLISQQILTGPMITLNELLLKSDSELKQLKDHYEGLLVG